VSGRIDFSLDFSPGSGRRRDPGQPLRILILSDLSGSTARGELGDRKPFSIDIDALDARFAALNPSAQLSEEIVLSFESLDDLHPDRIFHGAELFRSFRELRARLSNSATFAEAAAELSAASGEPNLSGASGQASPSGASGAAQPAPSPGAPAQPTNEFERLLRVGGSGTGSPASTSGTPARVRGSGEPIRVVDDLIARMVAPHVEAAPDARQAQLIAAVDQAISDTMRAVLGHPAVRHLEEAWLGLSRLVRGIDGENVVELFVMDVSIEELRDATVSDRHDATRSDRHDATRSDRHDATLSDSALHRALVAPQQVPGTTPWSVWVADFAFGASVEDLRVLDALGSLAAAAGAPLLADAAPALLGIDDFARSEDPSTWPGSAGDLASAWKSLRAGPTAPWIGLSAPRILLRLPYGRQTDPTESIRFEEMPSPGAPSYVWGSSALAIAQLAASSFARQGWGFQAPDGADIEDLPVHIYQEDGEKRARPTAEAYLTERAADSLLRAGIIPILSIRGRDAARVVRVQSIANPPAALRGPWV
jgi:type VI secretion system protein ImpC